MKQTIIHSTFGINRFDHCDYSKINFSLKTPFQLWIDDWFWLKKKNYYKNANVNKIQILTTINRSFERKAKGKKISILIDLIHRNLIQSMKSNQKFVPKKIWKINWNLNMKQIQGEISVRASSNIIAILVVLIGWF